ncbi:MAG: hypothetical protein K8R31_02970 [Bacteroidales bacterium]|nr:hypothetical protein [Bacteroidales bacterium]
MKRLSLITIFLIAVAALSKAQYIFPVSEYSSEMKNFELSNFDISDTVLYLPLGKSGLHILNIKDINNISELSVYTEYEKRSREKIYGIAHCVKVINNRAYLSYGPLGLKILDVTDPTMPYQLGTYYRYQDVYCSEIYENYALLGYIDMGLEIVDLSDLDNINMVSRNNVGGFTVENIQIIPPYIIILGGKKGLRTFKFQEPFTKFKQAEFPRDYLTGNDANKLLVRGSIGYLANDLKGLTVLNMGLPLYPLEVNNIKTEGRATDIIIDGNYIYLACGKCIEVYDIKDPEKPVKVFEYIDKDKKFESLRLYDNHLFALYSDGSRDYGIVIFQVE